MPIYTFLFIGDIWIFKVHVDTLKEE